MSTLYLSADRHTFITRGPCVFFLTFSPFGAVLVRFTLDPNDFQKGAEPIPPHLYLFLLLFDPAFCTLRHTLTSRITPHVRVLNDGSLSQSRLYSGSCLLYFFIFCSLFFFIFLSHIGFSSTRFVRPRLLCLTELHLVDVSSSRVQSVDRRALVSRG